VPSIYASLWILKLVSPSLRCFQQQNHRRLLNLFVLYLLTIDSDAALVSSTFEITHSLNFESRWLLPSHHLENSDFSAAACIVPAPKNRRMTFLIRNTTLILLTIDSDAALVSSTFEITHSSNFESRWLLPSHHLENSDFSAAACIVPAPKKRRMTFLIRNTALIRPKKSS